MSGLLLLMGRRATLFLAFGAFLGLALPSMASLLRPWLILFIIGPLVIALMRIDWAEMLAHARRLPLLAALAAWMLIASPALVFLCLYQTGIAPGLIAGIVLMAAAPPIVSAAAIALFLGLDAAIIVVATVLCMGLTPLILPPMALLLLDLQIDISLQAFMGRLALLTIAAFAAAWIARRLMGAERLLRARGHLDGLAVLSMLFFILSIFDGVQEMLVDRPRHVLIACALGYAFNLGLQIVSAAVFWSLGRRRALSIGLMAGNCNMGLVLVTLAGGADADTAMFFAIAQLPMYTLPILLTPLYRRLMAPEQGSNPG